MIVNSPMNGPVLYTLPELPQGEALEVLERIEEAERVVAPQLLDENYLLGTAISDNETQLLVGPQPGVVLTEHATVQQRKAEDSRTRTAKQAEWGIAGLGQILHEDTGVTHITPIGRQTGDANKDLRHPLKTQVGRIIRSDRSRLFTTIHGMGNGIVGEPGEYRSYDAFLGVGASPSEATTRMADRLTDLAGELDLKIGTNQRFVYRYDEAGHPVYNRFAAKGPGTSRVYAETVAQNAGIDMAAVQIELAEFLRLSPRDVEPDRYKQAMGVYLGFLLLKGVIAEFLTEDKMLQ
jgi:hypothetical protein